MTVALCGRRFLYSITLLLTQLLLPALLPAIDEAFIPEIRSLVSYSVLADNDTYYSSLPNVPEPGLRHLFSKWSSLIALFPDLVKTGNPEHALIQYSHRDSSFSYALEASIHTGWDHRWDDPGDYGLNYIGFRVNSVFNEKFRARANFWNGRFFGDQSYVQDTPLIDGISNLSPNGDFLDNVNGELSYKDKHFKAALGRGRFQIGNSISGSVVLSDRVNDYDYLVLEQDVGDFRFSFLHGTLMADSLQTGSYGDLYPPKYLAVHQVTYQLRDWVNFFYGETAVYGNKIDFSYLLPANFWRAGKYNLRDRDNIMLYGGTNIKPSEYLTLYGMLAIDELTVRKLFSEWWGNKYALQAGASLLLAEQQIDRNIEPRLTFEATAIRPWTYTHIANVAMYSHDQHPLGYEKGSNLVDLSLELNLPLADRTRLDSQISCTWQGSEGNDWRLNYQEYFPTGIMTEEAHWLEGDITFTTRLRNTLRIGILAHHILLLGHDSLFGSDSRHKFYAGWQVMY